METLSLRAHPDHPPPAKIGVPLAFEFVVRGDLHQVRLPDAARGERRDGLWQHSCVELFVREKGRAGYHEFNVSPSTDWAAYRFQDYRNGQEDVEMHGARIVQKHIQCSSRGRLSLKASFMPEKLQGLSDGRSWLAGLSAVLEHADGSKSYWALRHPSGPPDFHHPDCFALELPPPSGG